MPVSYKCSDCMVGDCTCQSICNEQVGMRDSRRAYCRANMTEAREMPLQPLNVIM